jgi:hypothetical protein
MLADVDSGSDTPSMVGNVLKWRKAEPAVGTSCLSSLLGLILSDSRLLADQLWEGLDKCNRGLGDIINRLSQKYKQDPTEYENAVNKLAREAGDEVCFIHCFGNTNLDSSTRSGSDTVRSTPSRLPRPNCSATHDT